MAKLKPLEFTISNACTYPWWQNRGLSRTCCFGRTKVLLAFSTIDALQCLLKLLCPFCSFSGSLVHFLLCFLRTMSLYMSNCCGQIRYKERKKDAVLVNFCCQIIDAWNSLQVQVPATLLIATSPSHRCRCCCPSKDLQLQPVTHLTNSDLPQAWSWVSSKQSLGTFLCCPTQLSSVHFNICLRDFSVWQAPFWSRELECCKQIFRLKLVLEWRGIFYPHPQISKNQTCCFKNGFGFLKFCNWFLSFPSEQLSCTSPFFVPSFHFFAEIPCSNYPPLVQMSLDCRSALAQKD